MARSLLRAGRRVVVNDVCQTAMRTLEQEGATAAATPSALAAAVGAGTLITHHDAPIYSLSDSCTGPRRPSRASPHHDMRTF